MPLQIDRGQAFAIPGDRFGGLLLPTPPELGGSQCTLQRGGVLGPHSLAIEIAAVVGGLCEQLGIETLKLPCLPGR